MNAFSFSLCCIILGSDLNTVIGAAVSSMLGRAADDLLPSGAETPQGWVHHDLSREAMHASALSGPGTPGAGAGGAITTNATTVAVNGTTIGTPAAVAAAQNVPADLEYEPPADLVRLLGDRLTVELFALRNQVNLYLILLKSSSIFAYIFPRIRFG